MIDSKFWKAILIEILTKISIYLLEEVIYIDYREEPY